MNKTRPNQTTEEKGKLRTWEGWSSKNAWVSRANARDEWIARTSDDQIIINILACKRALVTRAHDFLSYHQKVCK